MILLSEHLSHQTAEQLAQLTLEQPLELRVEFIGNIGDNLHFAFNEILAADLRVIIGLFSQKAARRVLCEVTAASCRQSPSGGGHLGCTGRSSGVLVEVLPYARDLPLPLPPPTPDLPLPLPPPTPDLTLPLPPPTG